MPLQDKNSYLSNQTNMRIEFGNAVKTKNNVKKVTGLYRLNTNPIHYQPGEKLSQTASDPLHRNSNYIMLEQRLESSSSGRSRGYFRPAAPGQVNWKYSYWRVQPAHKGASIGPYNVQNQQSIFGRISGFLSGLTTGNK